MSPQVHIDRELVSAFCKRHHIKKLSFFGSVLRDYCRSDSRVDVLVEFDPKYSVGLIRLAGLESELSEIVGRKVDLRTPAELSRYFRQEVIATSLLQYAQE